METTTTAQAWARGQLCLPPRQIGTRHACCLTPYGPPPDMPDLAIYSQAEQFAMGSPPTWDSPDILTNFWNPFRLMPEGQVTVRNLSPTATAANAHVLFSTATFGIGQPHSLMGSQVLTLGPGQQATLNFPFPQHILAAAEQRIAVHISLAHPYDVRQINNRGSQLLADAYTSKVGRTFSVQFPVLNPLTVSQAMTIGLLPNQLSASVSPSNHLFSPLQQITCTLSIYVPGTVHGTAANPVRLDATVIGRDASSKVVDGLTYVIWADD